LTQEKIQVNIYHTKLITSTINRNKSLLVGFYQS